MFSHVTSRERKHQPTTHFRRGGGTSSILGSIVTSERPPTPLDAGRWGQLLFSKVLAESGGDESLNILQTEPVGTNNFQKETKRYQQLAEGRPKYIKKSLRFQDRKKVSAGQCFGAIFSATWSMLASLLVAIRFRRADPLGVFRFIWCY